jgi:hypothetical protein
LLIRDYKINEKRRRSKMGYYRFWRRVKVAPGVTLNLSRSGGSLSFGPRGAKFTAGARGARTTVGVPGTGLFYTSTVSPSGKSRGSSHSANSVAPAVRPEDRLGMGFFKRLVTPQGEEALVDGFRELVGGNEDQALVHLRKSVHLADGAFLAGFLSLKKGRLADAERYLTTAAELARNLGRYFKKYGISAAMSLPVTDEVAAHVGPNIRGVLLGLVETYQRKRRWQDAMSCLERLRRLSPDDVVVKLSLAELVLEADPKDKDTCQKVVRLARGVRNDSPVHAALLLYKARALRRLELHTAARDVLTKTLRRTKDRSEELLRALRYERALVYEELGQKKRSRAELEKIYAQDPEFEDVAKRLGLSN